MAGLVPAIHVFLRFHETSRMDAWAQVPVPAKAPSGIAARILSAKLQLGDGAVRAMAETTTAWTITVGMTGDAACASGDGQAL